MAIRQLDSGRWQVDLRPLPRRNFATQAEAIEYEAKVKAARARGEMIPAKLESRGIPTWSELLDKLQQHDWKGAKSQRKLVSVASLWVRYIGPKKPMNTLKQTDIDKFVEECDAAGNTGRTINRKYAAISKMLKFAHRRDWIDATKFHLNRNSEKGNARPRFFSDEEEKKLLAVCRLWGREDGADFFKFAVDTGGRYAEIKKLQPAHISGNMVTFWDTKDPTGKGRSRTIPMTRAAREIVERRLNSGKAQPFARIPGLRGLWERARVALGMQDDPHWVIHVLRHTCASRLAQRGMKIEKIAEWMGHTDLRTTRRYMHFNVEHLQELADALDKPAPDKKAIGHLGIVKGGRKRAQG